MLWSAFAGSPTAIGTSPFQCESMQALKSAVKALSSPLSRAVFPGSLANSGTTVRPLAALRAKTASSAEAAKDSEAAGKVAPALWLCQIVRGVAPWLMERLLD